MDEWMDGWIQAPANLRIWEYVTNKTKFTFSHAADFSFDVVFFSFAHTHVNRVYIFLCDFYRRLVESLHFRDDSREDMFPSVLFYFVWFNKIA